MRKSRVAGDKRVRTCGQPGAIAHCTRPHRPLHRRYDAPWRPAARSTCSCARAPGAHAMAHARDPRISPDVLRAILWSRRCVLPLGSSPGVYTVFLFGAREVVNRRHDLHRILEHGFAQAGACSIPQRRPQCANWLSLCEMVFALRGARGGQSCGSRVGAVHLGSDTLSPRLLTAPASALGTRLSALGVRSVGCLAVGCRCSDSHAQLCRNSTPCDTQRPLDPSAWQHSAHSRKGNRSGD